MKNLKVRASSAGAIMGGTIGLTANQQSDLDAYTLRANGEGKPLTAKMEEKFKELSDKKLNPTIPEGLKTFTKKWFIQEFFNRSKSFSNKYTQKGIKNESESIDIIAETLGLFMAEKNEEYFENDFFTGTPDLIVPDYVIDVKNSWDIHTFPHFAEEVPEMDYYYQLQVYMELTGLSNSKLIYVLTDTPMDLIEREAQKHCYAEGFDPNDAEVFEAFKKDMTYSDVPIEKRIKIFDIERNDQVIEEMKERVNVAREYLSTLKL